MKLSANHIPVELVEEILIRLPLESIKRFQCVSKSWYLLINNDLFIKSQLQWSLANNSRRHLLISILGDEVISINLDIPGNTQVIDVPSCLERKNISVFYYCNGFHSCNGLVLVESKPPVLWNPFTRDYRILPGFDNLDTFVSYGFAYDSINDDYKVVRVLKVKTEIYSLKLNSWKTIENLTYSVDFWSGDWSFQIRGVLHAIVKSASGDAKIMAFSVETERHYELELPSYIDANLNLFTLGVFNLGGCLCVTSKNEHQTSIWVMKDYGETKSWTKLLSLQYLYPRDHYDVVKPLAYSKDGHKVMLIVNEEDDWKHGKATKLAWFDLRKNTMEVVNVEGIFCKFVAEACINSLVPLH